MGATGARISELLQMKVEHVRAGYVDLYTKHGRRPCSTRIYLRRTTTEQREVLDRIVTW